MGLGPLANALVQMELGESYLGALSMNTQGPDDATMLTLLEHGTPLPEGEVPQAAAQRREAHLLLDDREGRRRRRHRHAAPAPVQGRQRELRAERREVVLLGRQRRRHRAGHGQDRPRRAAPPAVLDLPRRAAEPRLQDQARHPDHGRRRPAQRTSWAAATPRSRSRTWKCRPRTCWAAKATASTWASTASPTAACATACTTSRWRSARSTWPPRTSPTAQTFGKTLDERQAVQFMLAECASQLYIARLMLLHIAYKAENKMDIRQENGIAKVLPRQHGPPGGRHRDPAARRARLLPRYAAGRAGTPTSARSAWSTGRTKCTAGRPAATSSRRSRRRDHGRRLRRRPAVGIDLLAVPVGRPANGRRRVATQLADPSRRRLGGVVGHSLATGIGIAAFSRHCEPRRCVCSPGEEYQS